MQQTLDVLRENVRRAEALVGLHVSLSKQTTIALDLSDLLRAAFVMAISALDQFIHELTRAGMLEIHEGKRGATVTYEKFGIPLSLLAAVTDPLTAQATLELEIRQRHSYLSFQQPDKIADAIRHVAPDGLWAAVAAALGRDSKALKTELSLIVDRRNKIAHEADVDPTYPGQRWPIASADAQAACDLIREIAEQIFAYVCPPVPTGASQGVTSQSQP